MSSERNVPSIGVSSNSATTNPTRQLSIRTLPPTVAESEESSTKNSERNAVVLALFGPSVGPCVGDFSTTYNRVDGRLYVATRAILFYSNLFGFERRLCLKISDIETVEAYRSTSIRISMVDCEDHTFRKFINRDQVLSVLRDIYRTAVSTIPNVNALSETALLDTAPIHLRNQTEEEQDDLATEEDTVSKSVLRHRLVSEAEEPQTNFASLRPRSRSVPSMHPLQKVPDRTKPQQNDGTPRRRRFRRASTTLTGRLTTVQPPLLEPLDDNETTELERNITISKPFSAPKGFDMKKAWEEIKQPLSDLALGVTNIPCSLEAFMNLFFADEASFAIERYQTDYIGDKDVSYSTWKKDDSKLYPPTFHRDISFIHPLNNSVGPSRAKTNRQQRVQRFGSHGICLQNVTMIQGIPGADCFRVEDRWIIETISEFSVSITVSFQVVFTKRTLFKPIIQKNSKAETKRWFAGYATYLLRALKKDDENDDPMVAPPSPIDGELQTTGMRGVVGNVSISWTSLYQHFGTVVILAISLYLVRIHYSLGAIQLQIRALEEQNVEMQKRLLTAISEVKQC